MLLLAVCSLAASCSAGSEERGRIRAAKEQLIGLYGLNLDHGFERLELKDHGIYVQDGMSSGRQFHHEGHWKIADHLLDGTEVILSGALQSDSGLTKDRTLTSGEIALRVHEREGKIVLTRNEVADWDYSRLK